MKIAELLALVVKLGPRIGLAWPYVQHIMEDVNNILLIINGGDVSFGAASLTPQAQEFVDKAVAYGIPLDQATAVAASAQALENAGLAA
jgi:hypothetical protein